MLSTSSESALEGLDGEKIVNDKSQFYGMDKFSKRDVDDHEMFATGGLAS